MYNAIAEICQAEGFADSSDESTPESATKADKGLSKNERGEHRSTETTVAGGRAAVDNTNKSTDEPKAATKLPTAASAKSSAHEKPDFRRDKDRLEFRREKERRRRGRGDTVLSVACAAGRVEIVDMLVKDGRVNKNIQNDNGETPLMRCCEGSEDGSTDERRFVACAQLLVKAGVQLNKVNFQGHTALHIAFQHKQYLVADYLINVGVKPCPGKTKSRCQKCTLNMKVWQRRRDRKEEQKRIKDAAQVEAPNGDQEMDRILEEEFGGMDFGEELARMKAEMGGRSIGFTMGGSVEEDAVTATTSVPKASANSVGRRKNSNRKRRKKHRKGKHRRGKRK